MTCLATWSATWRLQAESVSLAFSKVGSTCDKLLVELNAPRHDAHNNNTIHAALYLGKGDGYLAVQTLEL